MNFQFARITVIGVAILCLQAGGSVTAETRHVPGPVPAPSTTRGHSIRPRSRSQGPMSRQLLSKVDYGRLPLSFEENVGQVDDSVKFLARGAGYSLALKSTEAVFVLDGRTAASNRTGLRAGAPSKADIGSPSMLRMQLIGTAANARMAGGSALPGKVNYLIGNDSSRWKTNIPTYAKVVYRGIYPGVDLSYYGNQYKLEYDFIVAPGADPSKIAIGFSGAKQMRVGPKGDLVLSIRHADVRWHRPVVYQESNGKRSPVACRYVLQPHGRLSFDVGHYDGRRPLIIDPVFAYSTYLGSSFEDKATSIALDRDGNAYVTGQTTYSSDFIGTSNPPGGTVGFVSKLDPSGSFLRYSSFIGDLTPLSVAVDRNGAAYVAGYITAATLSVTNGAQATYGAGNGDGFLIKLNVFGNAVDYGTYLGGSGGDAAIAVALGPDGTAYVAGTTKSTDFRTVAAYQSHNSGKEDAFVVRIDTAITGPNSLLYSTYLGGSDDDEAVAIAVDAGGRFYVTGLTYSLDYPLAGAFQRTPKPIFVTAFDAKGAAPTYSTYFGSATVHALAVDNKRHAYITGNTTDAQLPIRNAVQTTLVGRSSGFGNQSDGFVTEFDTASSGDGSLIYSTYLGGLDAYIGIGIAVDVWGNTYISGTGEDASGSYPTVFVTKIGAGGGATLFSSVFSGHGDAHVGGMAVDPLGFVYVAGMTSATDFPTTAGAVQVHKAGPTGWDGSARDAFVFRMPTYTKLDFNGDGISDLLFQNSADGRLVYWLMQGDRMTSLGFLTPADPGPDWKVAGAADLNGDGQTDLIFQNASNGDVAYWLMNGVAAVKIGYITPRNPGVGWRLVGLADFNRDGYTDLLFRDDVRGNLYIWYMQGTNMISGGYLGGKDNGGAQDERVMAVGDLNNDGQADILFAQSPAGSLHAAYTRGDTFVPGAGGFLNPALPGENWSAAGLADLNGDGRPEILFQNAATGQLAYWEMDGVKLMSVGLPTPSNPGGPNWKLVGAN
jgi:hypothetical protein